MTRTLTGPILVSTALLGSAIVWAILLADSTVWAPSSATVIGIGLIVLAAVGVVGMVGAASRWAYRLSLGLALVEVMLAAAQEFSIATAGALALGAVALTGLAGTSMRGMIRQRPPADGPPTESVVLAIILLVSPTVWGLGSPDGLSAYGVVAVAAAWASMVLYVKAWPFALPTVRVALPAILLVCAVGSEPITGLMIGVSALAAGYLAWTVGARVAIHPLATPGRTVAIPPELAPADILDAARIDDRGRRLRTEE